MSRLCSITRFSLKYFTCRPQQSVPKTRRITKPLSPLRCANIPKPSRKPRQTPQSPSHICSVPPCRPSRHPGYYCDPDRRRTDPDLPSSVHATIDRGQYGRRRRILFRRRTTRTSPFWRNVLWCDSLGSIRLWYVFVTGCCMFNRLLLLGDGWVDWVLLKVVGLNAVQVRCGSSGVSYWP